jgi:hypothetical protein
VVGIKVEELLGFEYEWEYESAVELEYELVAEVNTSQLS